MWKNPDIVAQQLFNHFYLPACSTGWPAGEAGLCINDTWKFYICFLLFYNVKYIKNSSFEALHFYVTRKLK